MNNIEFATAIHILTLLEIIGGNLSSPEIAGSININPSMVRRSISILRKHGLVQTREGNGGGTALAKPAGQVLLSDVYRAVNDAALLGKLNNPNPECRIGKQINKHVAELYRQADGALIKELETITLADFCKQFI